jgi:hypothetical protein
MCYILEDIAPMKYSIALPTTGPVMVFFAIAGGDTREKIAHRRVGYFFDWEHPSKLAR